MDWQIEKGVRCDLVAYAAKNLSGKRTPFQAFPAGNRKGDIAPRDLASLVIRAPFGTRVILVTEPGPDWRDHPWRCVRIRPETALPGVKTGLPGVRIPDLDLLDGFDAKRTDPDLESTYPAAADLDGAGWTFGRIGALKGRVQRIRIEREDRSEGAALPEPDAVARAVLARLPDQIEAVSEALREVLLEGGHDDAEARVLALERWVEERR